MSSMPCELAERLRPYRLNWMEECLIPEDFTAHQALRRRLPWQTLATGEHWYTQRALPVGHRKPGRGHPPARYQLVRRPDRLPKIVAMAEAAGISVMLHGGARNPFGQHFSYAYPAFPGSNISSARVRAWPWPTHRACPVKPWPRTAI